MDSGHIVLDISGEERANTTVDGLLDQFAKNAVSYTHLDVYKRQT